MRPVHTGGGGDEDDEDDDRGPARGLFLNITTEDGDDCCLVTCDGLMDLRALDDAAPTTCS